MAVDYVCIITASILWHNVEYVKGRLCTKSQLNVLSGFHRQTWERSAYALQKRRAVKICKEYGDSLMSAAAAVCAIELNGVICDVLMNSSVPIIE